MAGALVGAGVLCAAPGRTGPARYATVSSGVNHA
jgi:hypothetical protein